MKKSVIWLSAAAVCIAAFVGVYALYNNLKKEYEPDRFAQVSQTEQMSGNESETTENVDYAAPDFAVLDSNGKEVKLSDYFGKPIVLNFWASWCYYCKEEMPDFNNAYFNHPDVEFMMINVTDGQRETLEIAETYVKEQGYDFPVYYDTELNAASTYGASGLPITFFIDKNGDLVTYASGMLTADNLEQGIEMIK